jgi:hypothetical protein
VNVLHRTKYTDLCYGYNAFWRYCLDVIALHPGACGDKQWGDGFEVETLINMRAASAKLMITEVPSFEHDRVHGVSNLNAASDGLRVLRTIWFERWHHRAVAAEPVRIVDLTALEPVGIVDLAAFERSVVPSQAGEVDLDAEAGSFVYEPQPAGEPA